MEDGKNGSIVPPDEEGGANIHRDGDADGVVRQFKHLEADSKRTVLSGIIKACKVEDLEWLKDEIQSSLAVDIVTQLPDELSSLILDYLTVPTLCNVIPLVCTAWRNRASSDRLWLFKCKGRGWDRLNSVGALWETQSDTVLSRKGSMCLEFLNGGAGETTSPARAVGYWKQVYIRAWTLYRNWSRGIYSVLPIVHGHKDPIVSMGCNGSVIATCSGDSVRITTLNTGRRVYKYTAHHCELTSVAISALFLVMGYADGVVKVYSCESWALCTEWRASRADSIDHITFTDNNVIITSGNDRVLKAWKPSGIYISSMKGHDDNVEVVVAHGDRVMTSSWDETIKLWDIPTGTCIQTFTGHPDVAWCCDFDNDMAVSGGAEGYVKIWSIDEGICSKTLIGHSSDVHCVVFNRQYIASGSADSTVRVWSLSGKCLHVLEEHVGVVRGLILRPDFLVSGGDQKKLVIWDPLTGAKLNVVHRNPSLVLLMWANHTKLVTTSPESKGTITIINYW